MSDLGNQNILLYGATGHAKTVAELVEGQGNIVAGIVDDQRSGEFGGFKILGGADELKDLRSGELSLAISCELDSKLREEQDRRLLDAGFTLAHAVDKSAQLARGAIVGPGSVVMPMAVIGPDAVLGRSCIVGAGALVNYDCKLGDYVRVAQGAITAGNVQVGSHVVIDMGAIVVEGAVIGDRATVGAGAVAHGSVPPYVVVAAMSGPD